MDKYMSIKQIEQELNRIDARLDEMQLGADAIASEIKEIAEKVKFYGLIMESWIDEDE
jgi:hypothetical protein